MCSLNPIDPTYRRQPYPHSLLWHRQRISALVRAHATAVVIKALHEVFFHFFYRTVGRLGQLLFILDFHIKEGIV
jgi:hypothetical protein